MTPQGPAMGWCPFPDEDSARTAAHALLDEGLIACANIVPGMTSLFIWNGEKNQVTEAGVLVKTDAALMEALVTRLSALHPYDEPAILVWRCDDAAPGTASWLASLVR